MKVKFANKVFEVLYTKEVEGLTMYAVKDEPNHIDWLINVEVIDTEKKELKKIEQNSTSEIGNYDHKKVLQTIINEQKPTEDEDREYACQSPEHYTQRELMIYNLGITDGKRMVENAINKTKQNPAWSEEDIATISRVISIVKWAAYSDHSHPILNDEGATELVERLKSLKERVQPKQEWNEEDEEEANYIADFIENLIKKEKLVSKKTMIMEEMVDWLRALRPPYYCDNCKLKKSIQGWKPSDEQMKTLKEAVDKH